MLNSFSKFIFVSSLAYSSASLAGTDFTGDMTGDNVGPKTLTVMTYNVENLFDAEHDEGKDDYTFLPKEFPGKMKRCAAMENPRYRKICEETDWKPELVDLKISQIKRVIEHQGFLPDIVGLQEVENDKVVNQLAKASGYQRFVITRSPDARGIDVALMFNEEKIQYVNHEELVVRFKDRPNSHSRNVLRVHFKLGKTGKKTPTSKDLENAPVLAVYVAHWPSQSNPKEMRLEVAQKMKADIEKNVRKYGEINYHVVVMGDLNTPDQEMPNGIHNVLANPTWKKRLYDVHVLAREGQSDNVLNGPPGSYYYFRAGDWNRLDRFLVSGNMVGEESGGDVRVMPHSFKYLTPDFMTYVHEEKNPKSPNYGKRMPHVPQAYDFGAVSAARAGFSDHLPVFMKLRLVE